MWTYKKLTVEMRKKGWRPLGGGVWYLEKNSKVKVNLLGYDDKTGVYWRAWAENEETPPPF